MYEKSCFVLLTNQCNLRCTHCYNVLDPNKSSIAEEENSLSIQKLSDLFNELIKNGFTKVLFSGGEALLRKDIFAILKEAKKKGLNTALFTNGHMLSEDVVDKLGEAGLKEIRISFNELVWIKNRKQYEKIFSNQTNYLSMLKNADISVGYVYIVSGYNIDYTYETYLNLQKLGASMKIQPLYIPKNFEKYDEVSASAIPLEKWEKLKSLFSNDNLNNTEIEEYPSSVYGANEEIINYIIVGILTTVVALATYYICVLTFLNPGNPIELQIANILSWIAGVIFAYFTNRKYVFNSQNPNKLKESLHFLA